MMLSVSDNYYCFYCGIDLQFNRKYIVINMIILYVHAYIRRLVISYM